MFNDDTFMDNIQWSRSTGERVMCCDDKNVAAHKKPTLDNWIINDQFVVMRK